MKRVFLDMDGTLLNSQGRVAASNAQLIRQAGLPITLVSARAPMEMREAIDALDLKGPQVGFNGGLIYQVMDGKIQPLHTQVIHKDTLQTLLGYIRGQFPAVSLSYYGLNDWYCDRIDEGIRMEHDLTLQTPTFVSDEATFLAGHTNIFKIMMISLDMEEMAELEKALNHLGLDDVSIQRSGKCYLEITHRAAKKSAGIAYILDKENLTKEEVAAFGDGHNDLPMFDMVGTPIVMANALEDVKAHAKYQTLSNDQDGVGHGIHKFLLGKEEGGLKKLWKGIKGLLSA